MYRVASVSEAAWLRWLPGVVPRGRDGGRDRADAAASADINFEADKGQDEQVMRREGSIEEFDCFHVFRAIVMRIATTRVMNDGFQQNGVGSQEAFFLSVRIFLCVRNRERQEMKHLTEAAMRFQFFSAYMEPNITRPEIFFSFEDERRTSNVRTTSIKFWQPTRANLVFPAEWRCAETVVEGARGTQKSARRD